MKNIIRKIIMGVYLAGALFLVCACSDKLDIEQIYPFSVEHLPVQKRIKAGETAEMRFTLYRGGYYEETEYFIRYFQPDGKGELRMEDGTLLQPNDLYPLPGENFRMYFTALSTDQHKLDIYIVDSYGQTVQLSFSFTNENEKEELPE